MRRMIFSHTSKNLLGEYFDKSIKWTDHPDLKLAFSRLRYKSGDLEVTINDFPEENMYSLIKDGKEIGSFNEWPKKWARPS